MRSDCCYGKLGDIPVTRTTPYLRLIFNNYDQPPQIYGEYRHTRFRLADSRSYAFRQDDHASVCLGHH